MLYAQVVEDQQRHTLHLPEQIVVSGLGLGAERRAQVLQQIGGGGEEDRRAPPHGVVGHRGGQVGLTGEAGAHQCKPALGLGGIGLGRLERGLESGARLGRGAAAIGVRGIEGDVGQEAHVAEALEPSQPLGLVGV